MNLPIDRSFVAIVPLGGRHVNHLWRLLSDLEIPYATLLDLDVGRHGGGWGRIKNVCGQLLKNGVSPTQLFKEELSEEDIENKLAAFDGLSQTPNELVTWIKRLQQFKVFFCWPLDLDMSMLKAFGAAYRTLEKGMQGPSEQGDVKQSVLGDKGKPSLYGTDHDDDFRWYRYLFLGRGKPSTHVRILGYLNQEELSSNAPVELSNLLRGVAEVVLSNPPDEEAC